MTDKDITLLTQKLTDKAKEAFLLAIEVFNKPSIRYRAEGFSFFICNAWELMLKAHMIKTMGESSIYFKDNPERTLSLENCIAKVYTNDKDPLRRNMEKILELRNISTHFITEEYEMVYIPLFQACVFNFIEKMQSYHDIDMSEVLPNNFLTLTVNLRTLDTDDIRAKYPPELADKLIATNENLVPYITENNSRFAINVEHHYYLTKNPSKASATVKIDPNSENATKIITKVKDPNLTHKYTTKKCCEIVNHRLKTLNIPIKFNMYVFNLFCKYYDIKSNPKLCFVYNTFSQPQYTYSQQAIDFIVDEIRKDPDNIVETLKTRVKQKS